jgi:hypothetical protein
LADAGGTEFLVTFLSWRVRMTTGLLNLRAPDGIAFY